MEHQYEVYANDMAWLTGNAYVCVNRLTGVRGYGSTKLDAIASLVATEDAR